MFIDRDRKCCRKDIKRGEPDAATQAYSNTHTDIANLSPSRNLFLSRARALSVLLSVCLFLSPQPEEAMEYGIIDEVIQTKKSNLPKPPRPTLKYTELTQ